MIDIKDLRLRPEIYRDNLKKKNRDGKIIDEVLGLDEKWRSVKLKADNLRSERNQVSEAINKAKKEKKDASSLISKAKGIPGKLRELEEEENKVRGELDKKLSKIPNIMSSRVPLGKSDKENVVDKVVGKPGSRTPTGTVKSHVEIAEALGM